MDKFASIPIEGSKDLDVVGRQLVLVVDVAIEFMDQWCEVGEESRFIAMTVALADEETPEQCALGLKFSHQYHQDSQTGNEATKRGSERSERIISQHDIDTMSVRELNLAITERGGNCHGCIEKEDLKQRLIELCSRLESTSRGEGCRSDGETDPLSSTETLMESKSSSVSLITKAYCYAAAAKVCFEEYSGRHLFDHMSEEQAWKLTLSVCAKGNTLLELSKINFARFKPKFPSFKLSFICLQAAQMMRVAQEMQSRRNAWATGMQFLTSAGEAVRSFTRAQLTNENEHFSDFTMIDTLERR